MSGIGQRFLSAGYQKPKPLIEINGRPMIEYVVSMFPGNHEFVFICNRQHLEETNMREVLNRIKPNGKIISVEPHKKGPIFSIVQAEDEIKDDEGVLVSYCDLYMDWDFDAFQNEMRSGKWHGAIPSITGFHPNLIHQKLFAGVLTDGNGRMLDIQEKHSFTENMMDSHHSTGVYYFSRGADLKRYAHELIDTDTNIKGEFYASMPYYLYKRDGRPVFVPEVERFIALGTPEDLEEFEAWSRLILGSAKQTTGTPAEREVLITIPYPEGSPEYEQSRNYWLDYFAKHEVSEQSSVSTIEPAVAPINN